ncbi:hypothetical protein JKP88DRAFT_351688 [Tribonema minus]|uniref:Translocator protein n=1 Tax=Tribonema minus TaxID=303371 RepID=A0A835YIB6_9STRA|nr:hypothetical protein JKP88DRAFT_351688 [Tribonema minus]
MRHEEIPQVRRARPGNPAGRAVKAVPGQARSARAHTEARQSFMASADGGVGASLTEPKLFFTVAGVDVGAMTQSLEQRSRCLASLVRTAETSLYLAAPMMAASHLLTVCRRSLRRVGARPAELEGDADEASADAAAALSTDADELSAASAAAARLSGGGRGGRGPPAARGGAGSGVAVHGRSDARSAVLATVETALEASLLVAFVWAWSAASARVVAAVSPKMDAASADALATGLGLMAWGAVVFGSGFLSVLPGRYREKCSAAASLFGSGFLSVLPGRYREKVQALSVDYPLQKNWYRMLRKPRWTPPDFVFPMAWIPLKTMQMFALSLLWDKLPPGKKLIGNSLLDSPVALFVVNKAIGDTWNKVWFGRHQLGLGVTVVGAYWMLNALSVWFGRHQLGLGVTVVGAYWMLNALSVWFGRHQLGLGVAVMGAYWAMLCATLASFFATDRTAFYLLAPTLVWVSLATALTVRVWQLNKGRP